MNPSPPDAQRLQPTQWLASRFTPGSTPVPLIVRLIILTLITFTLAQECSVSSDHDGSDTAAQETLVIVLDASASMAATDLEPSRWLTAIAQARALITTSPRQTSLALLRAGHTTRVIASPTRDRSMLHRHLDQLAAAGPDATPINTQALTSLLEPQRAIKGHAFAILTDKPLDHNLLLEVSPMASVIPLAAGDDNMAITLFRVRQARRPDIPAAAIVTVHNTGSSVLTADLQVSHDDILLEAHTTTLNPGEQRTYQIPIYADEGTLVARLDAFRDPAGGDARDMLAVDNVAYAAIPPSRNVSVLVVGDAPFITRALSANPRLSVESSSLRDFTDTGKHDVTVFARTFPTQVPQGRFLVIAPPEDNPLLTFVPKFIEQPDPITWDRGHPALLDVGLSAVRFDTARAVIARSPWIPIAEFSGDMSALMVSGATPAWRGLILTADPLDSNFPLLAAFPVFLHNAIHWLSGGTPKAHNCALSTGEPLRVKAGPDDVVTVTLPSGHRTNINTSCNRGTCTFDDTTSPGFYQVTTTSRSEPPVIVTFGVSMTHPQESQLAPATPSLKTQTPDSTRGSGRLLRASSWTPFIPGVVLMLLCLEWLLYLRATHRTEASGATR